MRAAVIVAGIMGASLGAARPAVAQQTVPAETTINGAATVTLYRHPFLTEAELATLRLVATDAQALSLFVPRGTGHAALAVAPGEGFVRNGTPVPSAVAIGDLPDLTAARKAALSACDTARRAKPACVVVLEVAPAP
ncbi:MAG: hypothetical protein JXR75_05790 [Rhodobacteraceae bacterium]|nr:hypothetical protein [Paracoccaceae bacterium]